MQTARQHHAAARDPQSGTDLLTAIRSKLVDFQRRRMPSESGYVLMKIYHDGRNFNQIEIEEKSIKRDNFVLT